MQRVVDSVTLDIKHSVLQEMSDHISQLPSNDQADAPQLLVTIDHKVCVFTAVGGNDCLGKGGGGEER